MSSPLKKVALGGGCFWCTEAIFKMFRGIISIKSGYAGGITDNPNYEEVSNGATGHAEVIYLEYDPELISFQNILTVFFASHDPTSLNRQGNDIGTQYRSIILYENKDQKREIMDFINQVNSSTTEGRPVVTEVKFLDKFYEAELYHQNYYSNNKDVPYCQVVINPKLEHVQKKFSNLLKDQME